MVLPSPIDAKILPGKALAFETGFLQEPDRRDVRWDARGFDPVKLQGTECERNDGVHRSGHWPWAGGGRSHPIAEITCLRATPTNVGERQPTNENFVVFAKN